MDCWMEITVSDCPPVSLIFTDMSSLSPSWSTISWMEEQDKPYNIHCCCHDFLSEESRPHHHVACCQRTSEDIPYRSEFRYSSATTLASWPLRGCPETDTLRTRTCSTSWGPPNIKHGDRPARRSWRRSTTKTTSQEKNEIFRCESNASIYWHF